MRRSLANLAVKGWQYDKCGLPGKVLKAAQWAERAPAEGEVVVKMSAAPILAQDVRLVMGVLGGLQAESFPATAGSTGAGEVASVGAGVVGLKKGSKVLLSRPTAGSWATEVTTDFSNVEDVSDLKLSAAQLSLLPIYTSAEVMATTYGDVAKKTVLVLGADLPQGAALVGALEAKGAKVLKAPAAKQPAHFIFNGVGGAQLAEAISSAAEGATVVTWTTRDRSVWGLTAMSCSRNAFPSEVSGMAIPQVTAAKN
eukprot:TRINITY_DN25857_c0_g1_i1.p1 TRINITY_DN25857_c0_g1~~TRINITY_DN25857_c0_g1_i1.p1  ORF type:complete len:255 (+),score=74.67 TRINITY_DN25857_c0_g1_i1:175-939(+)